MRISDWSSDVCSSDLLIDQPCWQFRARRELIGDDAFDTQLVVVVGPQFLDVGEQGVQRLARELIAVERNQHAVRGDQGRARVKVQRRRRVDEHGVIAFELRSEEHTSELQSLMRISYAVFCLKKKKTKQTRRSSRKYNI